GRGLSALKYLSRYLYRGVLPDKDIIDISDHQVTFRYTDSQTLQSATRSLPARQFLMLILQHVLPKGLQRVRDYGLLHG
ncbi:transposase, partial [Enterovibrio norvegicus]